MSAPTPHPHEWLQLSDQRWCPCCLAHQTRPDRDAAWSPDVEERCAMTTDYAAQRLGVDGPAMEAAARAVYGVIRDIKNPLGKTWAELTEAERRESYRLARAALEAGRDA